MSDLPPSPRCAASKRSPGSAASARPPASCTSPTRRSASRSSCWKTSSAWPCSSARARPAPERERPVLRPAGTRLSGRDRRRHAGGAGTSAGGRAGGHGDAVLRPELAAAAPAALSRAPSALSRAAGGQSRRAEPAPGTGRPRRTHRQGRLGRGRSGTPVRRRVADGRRARLQRRPPAAHAERDRRLPYPALHRILGALVPACRRSGTAARTADQRLEPAAGSRAPGPGHRPGASQPGRRRPRRGPPGATGRHPRALPYPYWLVWPQREPPSDRHQAFADWLREEARRYQAEQPPLSE